MAENFPNLKRKMDIQVQESERVLNETNPERCTLIYTLFKFIKVKDKRLLKTVKEKKTLITFKGNFIGILVDISSETLQARRQWHDVFTVIKGKSYEKNPLPSQVIIQN